MFSRPRHTATHVILLVVCAAVVATGCTLVGLGIGAIEDSKRAKLRPTPTWRVAEIGPGTPIALQLDDGRTVEGDFDRAVFREPGEYVPAYEAARASRPGGVDLPELGPCALKDVKAGAERDVELLGIDVQGVVVETAGARTTVGFERVGALRDAHGRVVSGPALQRLADARQVPLLSAVVLRGVPEPVPAERIVQVRAPSPQKRNAKLIGALTGLALDAIVVVAVAHSMNTWEPAPCSPGPSGEPCTSCPFAFSFDGHRYVRDAELLGSATLQAAQQTDRAALDHLAEVDGEYRLLLANELREVDELDAVRLVAVDAPRGASVQAAPDGRLFAVSTPGVPRHAEDLRGRDVTRLVHESDGLVWFSNPWGRDPERVVDLRDGLIAEFDRPAGADSATLVFRLRSTAWAVHLLTEALALHGPDLPAWRARMNEDPAARAPFLGALRREVLPAVSVWDGAAWRPVGVLLNLGPWLDREQALRVSLQGLPGSPLRLRLESTPGLWIVDSIAADFGTPPPVDVTVLTPRRADFHGRDVRDVLRDADGQRVSLRQGEVVEMAFAAAPPRANRSRRVFLEATGFYTPLVPTDREARPEEFEELVHQPGAIARWSLGLFRAELDRSRLEER